MIFISIDFFEVSCLIITDPSLFTLLIFSCTSIVNPVKSFVDKAHSGKETTSKSIRVLFCDEVTGIE